MSKRPVYSRNPQRLNPQAPSFVPNAAAAWSDVPVQEGPIWNSVFGMASSGTNPFINSGTNPFIDMWRQAAFVDSKSDKSGDELPPLRDNSSSSAAAASSSSEPQDQALAASMDIASSSSAAASSSSPAAVVMPVILSDEEQSKIAEIANLNSEIEALTKRLGEEINAISKLGNAVKTPAERVASFNKALKDKKIKQPADIVKKGNEVLPSYKLLVEAIAKINVPIEKVEELLVQMQLVLSQKIKLESSPETKSVKVIFPPEAAKLRDSFQKIKSGLAANFQVEKDFAKSQEHLAKKEKQLLEQKAEEDKRKAYKEAQEKLKKDLEELSAQRKQEEDRAAVQIAEKNEEFRKVRPAYQGFLQAFTTTILSTQFIYSEHENFFKEAAREVSKSIGAIRVTKSGLEKQDLEPIKNIMLCLEKCVPVVFNFADFDAIAIRNICYLISAAKTFMQVDANYALMPQKMQDELRSKILNLESELQDNLSLQDLQVAADKAQEVRNEFIRASEAFAVDLPQLLSRTDIENNKPLREMYVHKCNIDTRKALIAQGISAEKIELEITKSDFFGVAVASQAFLRSQQGRALIEGRSEDIKQKIKKFLALDNGSLHHKITQESDIYKNDNFPEVGKPHIAISKSLKTFYNLRRQFELTPTDEGRHAVIEALQNLKRDLSSDFPRNISVAEIEQELALRREFLRPNVHENLDPIAMFDAISEARFYSIRNPLFFKDRMMEKNIPEYFQSLLLSDNVEQKILSRIILSQTLQMLIDDEIFCRDSVSQVGEKAFQNIALTNANWDQYFDPKTHRNLISSIIQHRLLVLSITNRALCAAADEALMSYGKMSLPPIEEAKASAADDSLVSVEKSLEYLRQQLVADYDFLHGEIQDSLYNQVSGISAEMYDFLSNNKIDISNLNLTSEIKNLLQFRSSFIGFAIDRMKDGDIVRQLQNFEETIQAVQDAIHLISNFPDLTAESELYAKQIGIGIAKVKEDHPSIYELTTKILGAITNLVLLMSQVEKDRIVGKTDAALNSIGSNELENLKFYLDSEREMSTDESFVKLHDFALKFENTFIGNVLKIKEVIIEQCAKKDSFSDAVKEAVQISRPSQEKITAGSREAIIWNGYLDSMLRPQYMENPLQLFSDLDGFIIAIINDYQERSKFLAQASSSSSAAASNPDKVEVREATTNVSEITSIQPLSERPSLSRG